MNKRICTMLFRPRNAWQVSGAERVIRGFIMCWLLVAGFLAMGQTSELTIDSFQYSTDSAAQAAWSQSQAGQPVTLSMTDGVSCLAFPCAFTANNVRGLWVKNVSLDLSTYSFIAMRLKSTRPSMYISIFFMTTGGGGYSKYFNITDQWSTYAFPLGDFGIEGGTATGWNNVTGACISCWGQEDLSRATVYVSNLRASAGITMIDSFQYPTDSAAQAAWSQSQAGQPVTLSMTDGVSCMALPCAFTTGTVRGLWVKNVSLDLSTNSFITMRLKTSRPWMNMSIYFVTTGGGSYSKSFCITDQWLTYAFPVGDFVAEGTPSGWDNVIYACISCWQDADPSPATVYVSDLRAVADITTIDSFQYSTDSAAQAAWSQSQAGQPVTPATNENVSCLALPCAFTTGTVRGLWVKNVSLDLSTNSFIAMRLKTSRPWMDMSIYFVTTGGGSYSKSFCITDQWLTYAFPVGDFVAEGTPSGWDNVIYACISCWQDADPSPAAVYVSDLHAINGSINLLPNSGFEVTTSEAMPDYWGPTSDSWGIAIDQWVLDTDSWRANWGVDRTVNHTPCGTNSLRIISSGADQPELKAVANWTKLTANTPSTLSVWLRSDQSNLPVTLKVFFYTNADPYSYSASTQVNTPPPPNSWQRYSLTFTPPCSSSEISCFVYPMGAGTLWVDDVQLENGTSATKWKPSLEDPYIEHQTVHKTVASIGDHAVTQGGNNVISIDSDGRFLVNGQPFIPMGIIWGGCGGVAAIPSPAVTEYIAKAGFNTIQLILYPPPQPQHTVQEICAVLDGATANGLKVIVMWDRAMPLSALGDWIDALKYHPSVIMWYVYDEPNTDEDWQNATAKYNLAKTKDPSRPAIVNVCQLGQLSQDWTSDVLTMDRYPIGNGNIFGKMSISDVGSWVATLNDLDMTLINRKPIWCWLQSMGYAYYCSREPTGAEAECMTYLALINGSRGIMYFDQKPRTMEQWNEMRILTDEVRTLTPALSSTDTAPTFSANSSSIHLLSKSCGGDMYLIAVNESPLPVTAELTSSEVGSALAAVLFENRSVSVVNGTITDTFAGYQRHVYFIASGAWQQVTALTVSITGPVNNSNIIGNSLTINATAGCSNGTIDQVEFYNGTTLLGNVTTAPYSYNWTNVTAGTYTLTAKVYAHNQSYNPVSASAISTAAGIAVWNTADINASAGSASYNSGVFTVVGKGGGITGAADGFRFVYQQLTGDCTITAKINAVTGTPYTNGRVGVMIRQDTASGAKEAASLYKNISTKQYSFHRRTTTGGSTSTDVVTANTTTPWWVRMVRTGNTLKAYKSTNGTTWTQVGANTTVSMTNPVQAGLVVTSGNTSNANTATISNVSITMP